MNKHQKTLNKIKNMGDKDLYNEFHLEWVKTLQELVDKHEELEGENKKLKQIIKLLIDKLVLSIEKEKAGKDNYELIGHWITIGDIVKSYVIITEEEYYLLKEMFEEDE